MANLGLTVANTVTPTVSRWSALVPARWRKPTVPKTHLQRLADLIIECVGEPVLFDDSQRGFPGIVVPKKGNGSRRYPQIVGLHVEPNFMLEEALSVRTPSLSVLSLAKPVDMAPFTQALRVAVGGSNNSFYGEILDMIEAGSVDTHAFSRQTIIWGPAALVLKVQPNAQNVLARAPKIFSQSELVGLWRELILRGQGQLSRHLSLIAAVSSIVPERSTFRVGDKVTAMWDLVLDTPIAERLKQILELPLDLLMHLENLGSKSLFIRMQATASGTKRELSEIEGSLRGLAASVSRIQFEDPFGDTILKRVLRSLPGAVTNPKSPHFGIDRDGKNKEREEIFEVFQRATNFKTDHQSGEFVIGPSIAPDAYRQKLLSFRWKDYPAIGIEGPSGAGKTVEAMVLAMQRTSRILLIHHTNAVDEFAGNLAIKLGGEYILPEIPMARTPAEFNAAIAEIVKEIEERFARWREEWELFGTAGNFPVVVHPKKSKNKALFAFYSMYFLQKFDELSMDFYKKYGWNFAVIMDDLGGIPGDGMDVNLGALPAQRGRELLDYLMSFIADARKRGKILLLTFQSQEFVKKFGLDAYGLLPMCLKLVSGNHHVGAVLYPPEVVAGQVLSIEDSCKKIGQGEKVTLPPGYVAFYSPYKSPMLIEALGA